MPEYRVIGLMSGTSLDGLDIAYCHFKEKNGRWSFKILFADTYEYSLLLRSKLATIHTSGRTGLINEHINLGRLFAEYVNHFLARNKIVPDFIASHGHTVFHQPERGITFQIGDGAILSEKTGLTVVCDFRSQDVALGGQGAPLVPVGDKLLFPDSFFCINLGGFANISFDREEKRIAFDICPVNIILNYLCGLSGMKYDDRGFLASRGNLIPVLFDKLNSLPYYCTVGPKSLGREWADTNVIPLLNPDEHSLGDLLYTFTLHIATQVKNATSFISGKEILLTGGGCFNNFLIENITKIVPHRIIIPDQVLIKYKEALIFAFLGVLKMRNEINVLSSVTGARKDHIAGIVYHAS